LDISHLSLCFSRLALGTYPFISIFMLLDCATESGNALHSSAFGKSTFMKVGYRYLNSPT
jgi:hypothetical protein